MESDPRPPPEPPGAQEEPAAPPPSGFSHAPLLAALLSGVTALVAQTVWIRALGRAVGTTTEALAAVAAVFLGGLGLGAALGGRRAARTPEPARAAGRCLLGAAVLVLVSPWLFQALPTLHLAVLGLLGQDPGPSPWPALLVALPLLLVPTVLMGASFPLLLEARRASSVGVGRRTGSLYALNTLGAALGTALTVLLLPALGERLTLSAAAGLEIVAGALLLVAAVPRAAEPGAPAGPLAGAPTPLSLRLVAALTGFVGLGAEVAGFRLLEPVTGPHLWGVALLLLPVLLGIALGGWVGGRLADRTSSPQRALATALAVSGALLVGTLWVSGLLPWLVLTPAGQAGASRLALLATGTTLALLPPLAAMGATFPLAVRAAAARGTEPAQAAGALGAWNAVGSVAGSLLVGFLVLPATGALLALLLLAAIVPAGGALLRLATPGRRVLLPAVATALPLLLLVAATFAPGLREALSDARPSLPEVVALWRRTGDPGTPLRLASRADARLYAEWFGGRPPELPEGARAVVTVREGRMGTVALLEEPGAAVRLRVNGLSEARFLPEHPDAGSATEVALGLLPCLTHPGPRRALVIGHGAGWTAETVLAMGLAHVDVAELDETVLAAVEDWRGHPLAVRTDPHAHLWLTDGRLLLRRAAHEGGSARYDVIASQPSHPWVPGAGHLFTREAYALARAALTEDGVFAQWVNLFEMSADLLRSALATFRDVFPACWLFLFQGEAVLLGFADRPALDPARWERVLREDPRVKPVAEAGGFYEPGDLWAHVTLDAAGLERFAPPGATRLVVDDLPALELGLAWRVLARAPEEELEPLLRAGFPPALERLVPDKEVRQRWAARAIHRLLERGRPDLALLWDDKVPWGADVDARIVRAEVARARGQLVQAETILRGVVEGLTDAEGAKHGDWVAGWIDFLAFGARQAPELGPQFLADATPVAARLPGDGRVRGAFARLKAAAGDMVGARVEYAAALAATSPPAPPGTAASYARLLLSLGGAEGTGTVAVPDVPSDQTVLDLLRREDLEVLDGDTLNLLVRLETRVGDPERARTAEGALRDREAGIARDAFRLAWARLPQADGGALAEAERAVAFDSSSTRSWELLGLTRLQRAAHVEVPLDRMALHADAVRALGRAWGTVAGARAAAQEWRSRAYLRWYGVSDKDLVRIQEN